MNKFENKNQKILGKLCRNFIIIFFFFFFFFFAYEQNYSDSLEY